MAVMISVSTPENVQAKVTQADGTEKVVDPMTIGTFAIYEGMPSITFEYVELAPSLPAAGEEPEQ